MNILLVEDDSRLAAFITKGLTESGYAVTHVGNGEDGYHELTTGEYDVAILDLMLPKLDGLHVIEQARGQGVDTPILILSAKRTVDERIQGLQTGGDDYLVKPFDFGELLARLQAILRRGSPSQPSHLAVGALRLDLLRRKVERNGKEIALHAREFSLLEYLMRNAGKVVSKTAILQHVWGYDFDPSTNVVETRMCRLRDKLIVKGCKPCIRTIRGFGYVLEEEE
ncbi:MAG: response regulator transcription factor [Candidatus Hydrogenedentes bacterium]|nr:response regulator transcription factor [Candidatus Hydrogenedentota bacterium]